MSDSDWMDDESLTGDGWEDDAPSTAKWESGLRGAGQGLSMGFADEITGGLESLFSDKTYEQARDESRANYAKAKADNPYTYGAGEVGGGVASAFIPGLNVAKGASLAGIAGKAALAGGLSGAGYSEADNLQDLAMDTGTGAVLGGGLGAAAGKIAPKIGEAMDWGASKVGAGANDLAERFAARAIGAERGSIKKLGMDKVRAAGRQALDEGVLSPLASTDDLIARNAAVKSRGGQMMGEAYDAIDEAGASTFNPLKVAGQVDEEIGGFYRSPINRGESNQLENTLESILMRGENNIPLREAQALKQELGKVANWKGTPNPTDKEKMAREAYSIVNKAIDDAIESGSEVVEQAGLKDTLRKGKDLFGQASTAETLLQNKQAREQGNKLFGLTDTIAGAGGLAVSAPASMGIMGAKKIAEGYGAQNAALGLDKVSKLLQKSPKMAELYENNPQAFNMFAQKMAQKVMPEQKQEEKPIADTNALMSKVQGTKYAQVLQNASQRGSKAVGATNFILQQTDKDYRKAVLGDETEEEFN